MSKWINKKELGFGLVIKAIQPADPYQMSADFYFKPWRGVLKFIFTFQILWVNISTFTAASSFARNLIQYYKSSKKNTKNFHFSCANISPCTGSGHSQG